MIQSSDLESFMVSPALGFLPSRCPSTSFSDPNYAIFDQLVAELPTLISTQSLRQKVASLGVLKAPNFCTSDTDIRRAYVVFGYLVHAYVWGSPGSGTLDPLETVPPQLTEPFLHACDKLGMEPVLSYAGLCLWNWTPKVPAPVPEDRFFELDELVPIASFTGTPGEAAFDHVSVLIEAEGGPLIPMLLKATEAARQGDADSVISALVESAATIERMKQHLAKLYSTLDVSLFYDHMRPFFNGGKGMENKGLPRGFVFRRADGSEQEAKCVGGSAAQSSLFQFLDVVLGITHQPVEGSSESLFKTMRAYMPGKHREFLEAVTAQACIRPFVEQEAGNAPLRSAYDTCLEQLRSWRGSHIAVVSKYVVRPARAAQAAENESSAGSGGGLQGTGGSDLVAFLRQSKDETA